MLRLPLTILALALLGTALLAHARVRSSPQIPDPSAKQDGDPIPLDAPGLDYVAQVVVDTALKEGAINGQILDSTISSAKVDSRGGPKGVFIAVNSITLEILNQDPALYVSTMEDTHAATLMI